MVVNARLTRQSWRFLADPRSGCRGGAAHLFRQLHAKERTIRRQIARERSLKSQFDDLFERAADIMVVHDRRGRVSTMNRAGEQLSGYSREEMRTLDTSWLFSEHYLQNIEQMLSQGAEALPRTIRAEMISRRRDRVPVEAQAKVLTADGMVTGVSVIARDLSESDHLEAQLQVGQIIMNLDVNARDAMPRGGTLGIETSSVGLGADTLDAIPGPHVMLVVHDTGVGMSGDVRRKLFEPFFTTKESGQGTGLGLSMVHAIVRQSGGHITVESELGKGSTFRVYLPVAENAAAVEESIEPQAAAVCATGTGVVLLAEDDRAVRRMMSNELRRRGFTVLEARHGGEALEICRKYDDAIDVVLTDVVMPTMHGVDLVAAATRLRPDMSVLFMSGDPDRARVGDDPQAPAPANVMMKPFTPDTVVARINDVLSHKAH